MGRRRQHSGGLALASDSDSRADPIQHLFRPCHFPRRFCQAFSTPVGSCYSRQTRKGKFEARPCQAIIEEMISLEMSYFFYSRNVWVMVRAPPHVLLVPAPQGEIVTNRKGDGLTLIRWHREKAGTVEHAHHVLKNELAAVALPSGKFGANAAWFRLNVLTYNLLSALKRLALPGDLSDARPKQLGFWCSTRLERSCNMRAGRCYASPRPRSRPSWPWHEPTSWSSARLSRRFRVISLAGCPMNLKCVTQL